MLFFLLAQVALPLQAQETRYRVELLLLTHLNNDEEPVETAWLNDYSEALDFLSPAEETDEDGLEQPEAIIDAATDAEELPIADSTGSGTAEYVNRIVHLEEMGEAMQEAWRRLRASGPFRPEQYLSWEQGDQPPFPTLRIHDLDVVLTADPWAEARAKLEEQSGGAVVFADAAGLDALSEDPAAELPAPVVYFRLDGSASLTRSRFLHLALDLQLRQPAETEPLEAPYPVLNSDSRQIVLPAPASFLVHDLKQRRQVRTGRMEYFDSPVMGVLAYITAIDTESGLTE
ncbi:MAG: hypothetical protein HKO99_01245 [Xanthomonadales bacterium]|nr:hypothetical protein [Xanthomonadales bacterium]